MHAFILEHRAMANLSQQLNTNNDNGPEDIIKQAKITSVEEKQSSLKLSRRGKYTRRSKNVAESEQRSFDSGSHLGMKMSRTGRTIKMSHIALQAQESNEMSMGFLAKKICGMTTIEDRRFSCHRSTFGRRRRLTSKAIRNDDYGASMNRTRTVKVTRKVVQLENASCDVQSVKKGKESAVEIDEGVGKLVPSNVLIHRPLKDILSSAHTNIKLDISDDTDEMKEDIMCPRASPLDYASKTNPLNTENRSYSNFIKRDYFNCEIPDIEEVNGNMFISFGTRSGLLSHIERESEGNMDQPLSQLQANTITGEDNPALQRSKQLWKSKEHLFRDHSIAKLSSLGLHLKKKRKKPMYYVYLKVLKKMLRDEQLVYDNSNRENSFLKKIDVTQTDGSPKKLVTDAFYQYYDGMKENGVEMFSTSEKSKMYFNTSTRKESRRKQFSCDVTLDPCLLTKRIAEFATCALDVKPVCISTSTDTTAINPLCTKPGKINPYAFLYSHTFY